MKQHIAPRQFSFAMLFDPAAALAAADRAAHWDLPRRMCRPLDHYVGPRAGADLAAYDAEIELAPIAEEEMIGEAQCASSGNAVALDQDGDFEDDDDL